MKDHQRRLLDYLSKQYQKHNGILSFADFMQIALYAPGLGYYSAGMQKFGQDGDFVTAPEISSLFSATLANQCVEILHQLDDQFPHPPSGHPLPTDLRTASGNSLGGRGGKKDGKIILELGAGSGRMACDLLHALAQQQCLPDQYWILEVSADLRERQKTLLQQQLPDYIDNIVWLDSLPSKAFTGIILANEVLDAMPVHLFQISHNAIQEGFVKHQHDKWQIYYADPKSECLQAAVKDLEINFAIGYTSEINLGLEGLILSLSQVLQQGVMLFIDYGFPRHEYYHPSRHMGTLMCHTRHKAHSDPMQHIGLQDITAHVDFTTVALAASHCQLEILGFTHQAGFLLDNGLMNVAEKFDQFSPYIISQQIQRLTQPHEMGELFKVMAIGQQFDHPLRGFQSFDQLHRL